VLLKANAKPSQSDVFARFFQPVIDAYSKSSKRYLAVSENSISSRIVDVHDVGEHRIRKVPASFSRSA
jgi:hypothetical protein